VIKPGYKALSNAIIFDDFLLLFIETRENNSESCYLKNSAIVFPEKFKVESEAFMFYILWCLAEEKATVVVTEEFFLIDISPSVLSELEAANIIGRELGVVELVMPGVIGGKMEERVWKAIDRLRVAEKEKRLNVYRKKEVYKNSN